MKLQLREKMLESLVYILENIVHESSLDFNARIESFFYRSTDINTNNIVPVFNLTKEDEGRIINIQLKLKRLATPEFIGWCKDLTAHVKEECSEGLRTVDIDRNDENEENLKKLSTICRNMPVIYDTYVTAVYESIIESISEELEVFNEVSKLQSRYKHIQIHVENPLIDNEEISDNPEVMKEQANEKWSIEEFSQISLEYVLLNDEIMQVLHLDSAQQKEQFLEDNRERRHIYAVQSEPTQSPQFHELMSKMDRLEQELNFYKSQSQTAIHVVDRPGRVEIHYDANGKQIQSEAETNRFSRNGNKNKARFGRRSDTWIDEVRQDDEDEHYYNRSYDVDGADTFEMLSSRFSSVEDDANYSHLGYTHIHYSHPLHSEPETSAVSSGAQFNSDLDSPPWEDD